MTQQPLDVAADTLRLVPTRPDAEIARELKAELTVVIQPVLDLLTKAKEEGFELSFSCGTDATGTARLNLLKITKEFP